LPQILPGNHLNSDQIIYRQAKKITVHSEPGMWFNTDGELFNNEPITFEVLESALRVVAPANCRLM
jgi:diacylglycerol kinase (ATP)